MKTDTQLKDDVLAERARDPSTHSSDIGVIVKDGVVTLTGHLDSYARPGPNTRPRKGAAWSAPGVATVIDNLIVEG